MKPLAQFPVSGKVCEIRVGDAQGLFDLYVDGSAVVRDATDARWLSDSALHLSGAKEVRWSGEAWAAWENKQ